MTTQEKLAAPASGFSVAIVGLGLMGGSLAAALREAWPEARILGVSRRAETVAEAARLGWIQDGGTVLDEWVPSVDLAVLATPVRTIEALVGRAVSLLKPGAVLTDLGSTKAGITGAMTRSGRSRDCVGGHPMCGRESRGLEAADAGLFRGATWVLCPTRDSDSRSVGMVSGMARAVGARPLIFDAAEHDAIVARTSHLPYVVAASLARAVAATVGLADLTSLSAGGYRDTSRLAASDPAMMLDILLSNREHLLKAVGAMRKELDAVAALLEAGDEAGLLRILEEARQQRRLP